MLSWFYEETATTDFSCDKCLSNINRGNQYYVYDGVESTLDVCTTCYLKYLNKN